MLMHSLLQKKIIYIYRARFLLGCVVILERVVVVYWRLMEYSLHDPNKDFPAVTARESNWVSLNVEYVYVTDTCGEILQWWETWEG